MPLPTFASETDVPESFRAEYEQRDGAWRPKIEFELTKEKGKRSTVLTEKSALETQKSELEAELARIRQELAGAQSGLEPAKLEAYAAPIRTELTTAQAALAVANGKIERAELLKEFRKTAVDAGMWMERVDDEDNTDVLLRMFARKGGKFVAVDKQGNEIATPPVELLKGLIATKPYLFPFKGGSGGDAQHSEGDAGKAPTAADAARRFQAQRDAAPNPLAPPKAVTI